MKLGLINSAWFGTSVSTARGIELTKQIGFDTIDIFADPLEITPQERRTIRESCAASDLPVVSVVCCALGIADFNTSVRQFHIERAKRHLDLVRDLSGENLLLVLGEYLWNREVVAAEDQWKWAVEAVQELGEYADRLHLDVALEIEPFHLSIINNVAGMRRFLQDVERSNVKANIDISHLALAHDKPALIGELRGHIGHVHLSDCDGRKHGDLPPGRGIVDFPPFLKALAESGFNGAISIELEYSPEPGQIESWVREAYQSASHLMAEQGIRS